MKNKKKWVVKKKKGLEGGEEKLVGEEGIQEEELKDEGKSEGREGM